MRSFNALLLTGAAAVAHAKTVPVAVGADGGVTFGPGNSNAVAGDIIQFQFLSTGSVVQAAYDKPCQPLAGGFASGVVQAAANGAAPSTFSVTLADDKPVYFYSGQADACKKGMVGSVNAPTTGNTLSAWVDLSKASTNTVNPSNVPFGGVLAYASGKDGQPVSTAGAVGGGSPTNTVAAQPTEAFCAPGVGDRLVGGVAGASSVSGTPVNPTAGTGNPAVANGAAQLGGGALAVAVAVAIAML